ncbi:MAG TPA: VWA domain-containing protein [Pyrinomonadaceae bacterium]
MKASRSWCVLLLAVTLTAAAAAPRAQESKKKQPAEPRPLTVRLSALVLDARDKPVGDLRAEDFQVVEDGAPQKVTHFEKLEGPHAFGLLVDSSGSLRSDINYVVSFGKLVVNGTGENAAGFVVSFISSDNIKVFQDTTTDKRALNAALDDIFIEGGQTAINDAVYLGAERLGQFKKIEKMPRRYSVVVVTDGEDRASWYKDEDVFKKVREAGVRLFVIGLVQKSYRATTAEKAKQYMRRLASESGGSVYFFKKGDELAPVAQRVLEDMNANYLIGYESTNPRRDGSARKIAVSVAAGAGGEARKVFARDGYDAPKK